MTVRELLREVEREMARALDLQPMPLPPELACARGCWKGGPVELEARACRGGVIRYARCIELWGGELSIANVLVLPRVDLSLPVFGLDVVATGRGSVMVAADLSPVAGGALPDLPPHGFPSGGELPEWCRRWFSPQAVYTRMPLARLSETREAVLDRVRALASIRPEPAQAAEGQRGYCRAHLEDDKGLGMLARMFGEAWAARFVREVMFPA